MDRGSWIKDLNFLNYWLFFKWPSICELIHTFLHKVSIRLIRTWHRNVLDQGLWIRGSDRTKIYHDCESILGYNKIFHDSDFVLDSAINFKVGSHIQQPLTPKISLRPLEDHLKTYSNTYKFDTWYMDCTRYNIVFGSGMEFLMSEPPALILEPPNNNCFTLLS